MLTAAASYLFQIYWCGFYCFGVFWGGGGGVGELKSALIQSLGSQSNVFHLHPEQEKYLCLSVWATNKSLERSTCSSGKDTDNSGRPPASPWLLDAFWRWMDPENPVKRWIKISHPSWINSSPLSFEAETLVMDQSPKKLNPQLSQSSFSCWFTFSTQPQISGRVSLLLIH